MATSSTARQQRRPRAALRALLLALCSGCAGLAAAQDLRLDLSAPFSAAPQVLPGSLGVNLLARRDTGQAWGALGVAELFRDSGLRVVRYPGGEDADVYDWKTNHYESRIGPMDGPPPQEFLAQLLKAVPGTRVAIVVNLEQAFVDGFDETRLRQAADSAAAWVKAVRDAGLSVPWWEIGNESYLLSTRFPLTAEEYATAVKIFAQRMRAADPRIRIGAQGPNGWEGRGFMDTLDAGARARLQRDRRAQLSRCGAQERDACRAMLNRAGGGGGGGGKADGDSDGGDRRWWPTLARLAGDAFDFAVMHVYEEIDGVRRTDALAHGPKLQRQIENLREQLQQATGSAKGMAVTEWNTSPVDDPRDLPRRHTLYVAENVLALTAAATEYSAYWPLRLEADARKLRVPLLAEPGTQASAAMAVLTLANQTLSGRVLQGSGKLSDAVYAVALREGRQTRVGVVNTADAPVRLRLDGLRCEADDRVSSATVSATAAPPPPRQPLAGVQRSDEACSPASLTVSLPPAAVRFIRIGPAP